jgi:hypothetical protein
MSLTAGLGLQICHNKGVTSKLFQGKGLGAKMPVFLTKQATERRPDPHLGSHPDPTGFPLDSYEACLFLIYISIIAVGG